jgi:hypothetical protein
LKTAQQKNPADAKSRAADFDVDFSQVISLQIKVYYLKQKQMEFDQQAIFDNIVKWICMKTNPRSSDAAEILASFFVQNCEIFE